MIVHCAVLLKAPRAGYVKTRLASEIGELHALRLYRLMAGRVLAALQATGAPTTIWYAPPEARPEMWRWLGQEWDLRPQASGDLGARLAAAARAAPEGTGWLAVGGDCPDLTSELLLQAAEVLKTHEVVLGPAFDGGYYLIGGRVPLPDLFSGIPWGTDQVLQATRERLQRDGVAWEELPALRDVDTADDARATRLLT